MKIYIITATYCLNANGCEIEFEEFIDMFTEYFDADAWFAHEIESVRNSRAASGAKCATLKLCAVPLVGNVLEKQNTSVLRTVQV